MPLILRSATILRCDYTVTFTTLLPRLRSCRLRSPSLYDALLPPDCSWTLFPSSPSPTPPPRSHTYAHSATTRLPHHPATHASRCRPATVYLAFTHTTTVSCVVGSFVGFHFVDWLHTRLEFYHHVLFPQLIFAFSDRFCYCHTSFSSHVAYPACVFTPCSLHTCRCLRLPRDHTTHTRYTTRWTRYLPLDAYLLRSTIPDLHRSCLPGFTTRLHTCLPHAHHVCMTSHRTTHAFVLPARLPTLPAHCTCTTPSADFTPATHVTVLDCVTVGRRFTVPAGFTVPVIFIHHVWSYVAVPHWLPLISRFRVRSVHTWIPAFVLPRLRLRYHVRCCCRLVRLRYGCRYR